MDWALQIGKNFSIGILDLSVVFVILLTAIACTAAGFSRSAAKSLGWILCYPIALYLTSLLARVFNENSNIGLFLSTMFAFATISVAVFVICNLLGTFLGGIFSATGIEVLDSILGFVWGIAVALFISGLVIYILSTQGIVNVEPLIAKSSAYKLLSPLFPSTKEMIVGVFDAIV